MKVKKLIPLSTLIVDTDNGHIQLSSDEVKIDVSGIVRLFSEQSILLELENGEGKVYFFDSNNPQRLFLLEQVLAPGKVVMLELSEEGKIIGLDAMPNLQMPSFSKAQSPGSEVRFINSPVSSINKDI